VVTPKKPQHVIIERMYVKQSKGNMLRQTGKMPLHANNVQSFAYGVSSRLVMPVWSLSFSSLYVAVTTVAVCHTSYRGPVLHLLAGHCTMHRAVRKSTFLPKTW